MSVLIDTPGLDTALELRLREESGWTNERLSRLRAQCKQGTFARFLIESGTIEKEELERLLRDAAQEDLETQRGWSIPAPQVSDQTLPARQKKSTRGSGSGVRRNPYMPKHPTPPVAQRRPRHNVPMAEDETKVSKKSQAALAAASSSGKVAELSPGALLGPYTIERLLGAGGMGEVYLAKDPIGNQFAVKTLRPKASEEDRKRFDRECMALRKASDQPNVVDVFDQGEHDGQKYVVLEYCPGGSLFQRLRAGPLDPAEAANALHDVAEGLEFLHKQGVVHRDLKPGNVLFDGQGKAKLTDFGVALLEGERTLTDANIIMGTPGYLSPEQVQGNRHEFGPRTDVYGLGAVLYACLTGEPPFRGRTAMEVLEQVVARKPTPPSQLNSDVTKDLDQIVLKALKKEPSGRFRSAGEFAAALGSVIDPTVVATVIPNTIEEDFETLVVRRLPPGWWRVALPWAIAASGWLALITLWLLGWVGSPT